jgi:esterase/lipase superfamily enzyme
MDESQLLVEAIARSWPEDPALLPSSAEAIEPELLDALRALDETPRVARQEVQARITELLRRAPTLDSRVTHEFGRLLLAIERAPTAPDALPLSHRHSQVEVLYATDRIGTDNVYGELGFGGTQGSGLAYGLAHVCIPDDHRMGRLPNPRRWRLLFRRQREWALRLSNVPNYLTTLAALRDRAPASDILVFVHGYNVSFADAIYRTAQLAYDLDFKGVAVSYSWSSNARTRSYLADGENSAATQRLFRSFLHQTIGGPDCGRVHVIAHSMGNRVLTEALSTANDYRLGQVVFAAPDLDARVFVDRAAAFPASTERYTLYVSAKDKALAISRHLAEHPRAGEAGPNLLVLAGIDTVDVTELDTDFLGHSYVFEHRSVVSDLYALIQHGHPPAQRFGLVPMVSPNGIFWMFRR